MFGKSFKLFTMFGFTVSMDWTWLILAALITWSLATGVFPRSIEGLAEGTYWLMGAAGVVGLLVSIVFHEMCHSLVARHYGLSMKGITLFIFGGVAEMTEEPKKPKVEFLMAIAGPVSSVVFGAFLFLLWFTLLIAGADPAPRIETVISPARQALDGSAAVLQFLWTINVILAVFNMIPAFPLDGGRVLRSILWTFKKDLRWATRVSSQLGLGLGTMLIVLGLLEIGFSGNLLGGIWWLLIGWFIRSAARQSYRQLLMRQALDGKPISRFMNNAPISVSSETSLQQLVEDYAYRHGFAMFPVTDQGRLVGCVSIQDVKKISRDDWQTRSVAEVMTACTAQNIASPNADAMTLLSQMRSTGQDGILVVDADKLVGIITIKDLLKFFALKVELEESSKGTPPIRIADQQ